MPPLQIYDRRERALVGAVDRALSVAAAVARPFRRRVPPAAPRRILLLRLERIGDLLMALPGIGDVRAAWPEAEIDLVVGSWNAPLAGTIEGMTRVESLDAAWLAREGTGEGLLSLVRTARRWRARRYDLAINFEPDVRSNLVLANAGAAWTAGYWTGGGGPLLDQALAFDPAAHTSVNARRLAAAISRTAPRTGRDRLLDIGGASAAMAARMLEHARRPLIGIHASGGREIKQWPLERFAEVGRRLLDATGGTIVLTGSPADRPLVETVGRMLPDGRAIDATGAGDLLASAAILQRLHLLVTGDTGPMHLAAAVATPIVAVFGPSDPARYAPLGPHDRVVRVDLPCAPCNRIRLPPARCVGHTPDCLASVTVDDMTRTALAVLEAAGREPAAGKAAGS
jgi:lipopolysaccharide heptosyltransferase II